MNVGKQIMEGLNVTRAADAVYLLVFGIYYARWNSMMRQLDEWVCSYPEKDLTKNSNVH